MTPCELPETTAFTPSSASSTRSRRSAEIPFETRIPRVAVALETYWIQGRQLIEGILRYMRLHSPWEVRLLDSYRSIRSQLDLKIWKPSGFIGRGLFIDECLEANVPIVFCDLELESKRSPDRPWARWPEVRVDDRAIGAMGAEHFLRRGYRNLAYCGCVEEYVHSIDREIGFRERAATEDVATLVYERPSPGKRRWEREQPFLARWLRSLPKPIGVLAYNDLRAQQVLATCAVCGLDSPSDVAVLGVDNDELFCEMSNASLSSVAVDSIRGGFRAAGLLADLMRGVETPRYLLSPPLGVVARKSTDFYPVDDELVERALRYIQLNIDRPLSAKTVASRLNVTRFALGYRFEKTMKTSVYRYIASAKIDRIAHFLQSTTWPLSKIARQTGFNSAAYLCEFFLANSGKTPGEFRRFFSDRSF